MANYLNLGEKDNRESQPDDPHLRWLFDMDEPERRRVRFVDEVFRPKGQG